LPGRARLASHRVRRARCLAPGALVVPLAGAFAARGAACYSQPVPMAEDPRYVPVSVKAPHGAKVMEIQWGDAHHAFLPHEILRGYCPCAHCQGHGGTLKFVPGGDLQIREIQQVGNYALQFTWGDRHDSGIYTYRYLRSLCQCDECKPTFDPERSP
jgi:DUF971 family protein